MRRERLTEAAISQLCADHEAATCRVGALRGLASGSHVWFCYAPFEPTSRGSPRGSRGWAARGKDFGRNEGSRGARPQELMTLVGTA
jgi:hypothetical protein